MDTISLHQIEQLQQDLHLVRVTVDRLQIQVNELMTRLQDQDRPRSFSDLEGIWEGADWSLEDIKAAEYQVSEDLL